MELPDYLPISYLDMAIARAVAGWCLYREK